MPHLNIDTYFGQIFWLAVSFGIFYLLVRNSILPKASAVLETRELYIGGDLDKAEDMKNKAEEVEFSTSITLQKASEEVRAIIDESRGKVEMRMQAKREELAKKLDATTKEAEKKIYAIEAESDKVVNKIANDISKLIAQKVAA